MVHQFFVETAPALRYIYTRENINFDVVISSLYKVCPVREINTYVGEAKRSLVTVLKSTFKALKLAMQLLH